MSVHWSCCRIAKIYKARQHCHHGLSSFTVRMVQGWGAWRKLYAQNQLYLIGVFCSTYKVEKAGGSFTGLNNRISRGLPGTAVWHIHHTYHNYSTSCPGGHRRTMLLRNVHHFKVRRLKETLLIPRAFIFWWLREAIQFTLTYQERYDKQDEILTWDETSHFS